jgi:RimJ/RimL family protein N-acetyltransferase
VLTTQRLELWQPQAGDLDGLNAINTDPRTLPFLGRWTPGLSDSAARLLRNAGSWSLYGYGVFMVRRRGEARIVGTCGVFHSWRGFGQGMDDTPEAGWIVHPDFWAQGIAGEAMRAALSWFDATHGNQRVACMIEEGHAVSDGLARKLGFVPCGRHLAPDDPALVLYERLHHPAG